MKFVFRNLEKSFLDYCFDVHEKPFKIISEHVWKILRNYLQIQENSPNVLTVL